jgi:DNA-binding transcriptional regulator YiaG
MAREPKTLKGTMRKWETGDGRKKGQSEKMVENFMGSGPKKRRK